MVGLMDPNRLRTRGPQDGRAAELPDDTGYRRGGPGGTPSMPGPKMPTEITDKPDGMVPTVTPNMPGPKLATGPQRAQRPAPVATDREGKPIQGVSGRLQGLLSRTSPYIQRARTSAAQAANRRGLLNTSIAAGAGEAAAIDAALPIAQADASIAAGERGMRSQEFMQQRGLTHEAEQAELQRTFAGRQAELDRTAQKLMQERSLSHDAAMQEANRELKTKIAVQTGQQHADALYQQSLDRLTLNTELPQKERDRMSEHYAYVYDQSKQAIENIYNVELGTNPRQRPAEEGAP